MSKYRILQSIGRGVMFTSAPVLRSFIRGSLVLALALACTLPSTIQAQTWPERPVRFILTLGPGSGTDIGTRLLADRLSKRWGQPVVVENRPGGDAIVAINAFLSANDDHVLLASPVSSLTAHPYMLQHVPYKESDLLPIARTFNVVVAIAVPEAMPVKALGELVQTTRAQPGKLNWAGTTGALDFLFAGFLKMNGLDMARVPYRNPQDAAKDLASERVQAVMASVATLTPLIQSNKVKLLAVSNSTRFPVYPDIPTVTEAGHPELTFDGLVGIFGPIGMPLQLREKIAADARQAVMEQEVEQRLRTMGVIANAGGPEQFAASIREQRDRLAAAAKALGLKAAQ
jgi:tripartite-type tricarboxylate transporter receptor subunit TctC